MTFTTFSLFFSLTLVVSASPGPLMLGCMATGARFGIQKAFSGMLAACAANTILASLSAIGVGLLISQHTWVLSWMKCLGALYLSYLGWKIISSPVKTSNETIQTQDLTTTAIARNFFIIALSNPKGLLYFAALYPQFIDYKASVFPQFLILTGTFIATDLVWMYLYAIVGKKIMEWLKAPKHQKLFNYFSGGLLISVAVWLALQNNY